MITIQENTPLKQYSTFKIGGPAKYFTLVKNISQLIEAIGWAKKERIPFFIFGEGSNILFPDREYQSLVIKIQILNFEIKDNKIFCGAGTPIGKIIGMTLVQGLGGFEWAAGIPGTIGGAVFGNAGAFGKEMKDIVEKVKVLNLGNLKIQEFKGEDCQFSYRSSRFKKEKDYIVIETKLRFKKKDKETIREKIKEYLLYRKEHHPLEYPSVGSIFKNIKLTNENFKLIKKFPELRQFLEKGEIPTAYLIHCCNLKGKQIGCAQISEKHPNFIINLSRAKAKDVIKLINLIKKEIKNKFDIELEEEIVIIK